MRFLRLFTTLRQPRKSYLITQGYRTMASNFLPFPKNEPATDFSLQSDSRNLLEKEIEFYKNNRINIPLVIDGKQIETDDKKSQVMPSQHHHILADYSTANEKHIHGAIEGAVAVQQKWSEYPFEHRAKIFLNASHLVRTKYRYKMLATLMLGQAKNAYQADIDGVAELIDFIEFNTYYAQQLNNIQTLHQPSGQINMVEYRPLEGFVAAVSPFNFTAIGGNLCTAPALMGNVVLWKPSNTALLSSHLFYQILVECGLPDGVIQFLPSQSDVFKKCFDSPHFAAVNFTGSSATFKNIWKNISQNIDLYKTFPRLIGECGGKNFHFVHPSSLSSMKHVVNSTIRSAFEFSGQKCSACSRIFIPSSQWEQYKQEFVSAMDEIKLGQPDEYDTFLSAVIDEKSFNKIQNYIDISMKDPTIELIHGGKCDKNTGYFIQPTLFKVSDMNCKIMQEEIFGPVIAAYVYEDHKWKETIHQINEVSSYGLTGSIFSKDRDAIIYAEKNLRQSAGNFYINDKCTGSVVAQQPFGGARMSGTNDKAGMFSYVMRFASPRAIKENFNPLEDTFKYDYMKN